MQEWTHLFPVLVGFWDILQIYDVGSGLSKSKDRIHTRTAASFAMPVGLLRNPSLSASGSRRNGVLSLNMVDESTNQICMARADCTAFSGDWCPSFVHLKFIPSAVA